MKDFEWYYWEQQITVHVLNFLLVLRTLGIECVKGSLFLPYVGLREWWFVWNTNDYHMGNCRGQISWKCWACTRERGSVVGLLIFCIMVIEKWNYIAYIDHLQKAGRYMWIPKYYGFISSTFIYFEKISFNAILYSSHFFKLCILMMIRHQYKFIGTEWPRGLDCIPCDSIYVKLLNPEIPVSVGQYKIHTVEGDCVHKHFLW